MRVIARGVLLASFLLIGAPASAQTADEIVEKVIAAAGGREALAKVTSRSTIGTVILSAPSFNDVAGTIEVLDQAPNKRRTLTTFDLSAFAMGTMTLDERFDGTTGYATDSLRGEIPLASSQVDAWRNAIFPTPFVGYKVRGTKIELTGKEKTGDKDAYVLLITPAKGPTSRVWIDATTYLPMKTVTTVEMAAVGPVEHTTLMSDFRDVDGVTIAFKLVASSSTQSLTIVVKKVEHNVKLDPRLFAKPAR